MGSFVAFLDPKVWAAFVLSVTLSFFSGCVYGKHVEAKANEAAKNASLITTLTDVRKTETQANESQNNVAMDYEAKIAALNDRAASAEYDLSRLRVKARTCPAVSPTGPATGKLDGAGTGVADGTGTSEVNLDDVAGQIKQLGVKLDAAKAKVSGLQDLVNVYQKVCGSR